MRARAREGLVAAAVAVALLAGCAYPTQAPAPSQRSSPSATTHHVDAATVGRSVDEYFANDLPGTYKNRQAILVSVDGQIVLERYWRSTAATSGDIESAGKTILSTLIGIALDEGKLRSLDQTVGELLPRYRTVMSQPVAAITLRQLLTMTSGLPSDDEFYRAVFINKRQDWVRVILQRGQTSPVGTFQYSSAGSHLLSAILSQATGSSALDYAREKLFDPLGISTRPATRIKINNHVPSTADHDHLHAYRKTEANRLRLRPPRSVAEWAGRLPWAVFDRSAWGHAGCGGA